MPDDDVTHPFVVLISYFESAVRDSVAAETGSAGDRFTDDELDGLRSGIALYVCELEADRDRWRSIAQARLATPPEDPLAAAQREQLRQTITLAIDLLRACYHIPSRAAETQLRAQFIGEWGYYDLLDRFQAALGVPWCEECWRRHAPDDSHIYGRPRPRKAS